jgi:hypothetical protein
VSLPLSSAQQHILLAVADGVFLKAHRDLDGRKIFQLHPLTGSPEEVDGADVLALTEAGLLDSNKKFPAATFWLTDRGRALIAALS